jgi:hypothetical protein
VGIRADLDDIPDLSDSSAVANTFSLFDQLHLVAKSREQSRRKILKTASENLEFLKKTPENLLKNLICQVKFSIKPQRE